MNVPVCSVSYYNQRVIREGMRHLCLSEGGVAPKSTLEDRQHQEPPRGKSSAASLLYAVPCAFLSPYMFRLLKNPALVSIAQSPVSATSSKEEFATTRPKSTTGHVVTCRALSRRDEEDFFATAEPATRSSTHPSESLQWIGEESLQRLVVVATSAFERLGVDELGHGLVAGFSEAKPAATVVLSVQLPVGVDLQYREVMAQYVAPYFLDQGRVLSTGEHFVASGRHGEVALTTLETEPPNVPVVVHDGTRVHLPTAARAPRSLRPVVGGQSHGSPSRGEHDDVSEGRRRGISEPEKHSNPPREGVLVEGRHGATSSSYIAKHRQEHHHPSPSTGSSVFGRAGEVDHHAERRAPATSDSHSPLRLVDNKRLKAAASDWIGRGGEAASSRPGKVIEEQCRDVDFGDRVSGGAAAYVPPRRDAAASSRGGGNLEMEASEWEPEPKKYAASGSWKIGTVNGALSQQHAMRSSPTSPSSDHHHRDEGASSNQRWSSLDRSPSYPHPTPDQLLLRWSKLEREWQRVISGAKSIASVFPGGDRDIRTAFEMLSEAASRLRASHHSLYDYLVSSDAVPYRGITLLFQNVPASAVAWTLPQALMNKDLLENGALLIDSIFTVQARGPGGGPRGVDAAAAAPARRSAGGGAKDVFVTFDPQGVVIAEDLALNGLTIDLPSASFVGSTAIPPASSKRGLHLRPKLLRHSVVDELARHREADREQWLALLRQLATLADEEDALEEIASNVQQLYRDLCRASGHPSLATSSAAAPSGDAVSTIDQIGGTGAAMSRAAQRRAEAATASTFEDVRLLLEELRRDDWNDAAPRPRRPRRSLSSGSQRKQDLEDEGDDERFGYLDRAREVVEALWTALEGEITAKLTVLDRRRKQHNSLPRAMSATTDPGGDEVDDERGRTMHQDVSVNLMNIKASLAQVQDTNYLLSTLVLPFVKYVLTVEAPKIESASSFSSHKELAEYLAASQAAQKEHVACLPGVDDVAALRNAEQADEEEDDDRRGAKMAVGSRKAQNQAEQALRNELRCFELLRRSARTRFPIFPKSGTTSDASSLILQHGSA